MKKKLTNCKKIKVCVLMMLFLIGFSSLHAQMVTVNPTEYPNALTNPGIGFRPGFRTSTLNWNEYSYPTVARHYIQWSDIESSIGDADNVQKIIDYCNKMWAGCEAANVKIIPRVFLQYGDGQYFFPSYLTAGDYKSEKTRNAVIRMIKKLGEAWDNDPRVAWVQTGIIGRWGEQENPVNVNASVIAPDNSKWVQIMGQAFKDAFPNKLKLVRNQNDWSAEGYNDLGVYWDSFAHTGQYSSAWKNILNANNSGRYLTQVVEGEVAYDWGNGMANFGSSPTESVTNPSYYNFIINTIKQLHCSALGWISNYTQGPSTATGANLIQKAFGYRFHVSEFKSSARTEPGGTLIMSAKIKNIGAAPIYTNWPVAFILVDESTRKIVHQSVINGTDIRTWRPGSNYDWDPISNPNGSKVYLNPAVDNSISASITIPSSIAPGQYLAGLAILDPTTNKPGVFFAVNNFFKESQSQPLCRIGIGVDVADNAIAGPFNNPVNDDTRSYLKIAPSTQAIAASAGPNGSISPSGNVQVNSGLSQAFTITANNGYVVDDVKVDGTSVGAVTSYTFSNVTANHSIAATFKLSNVTYTITANTGPNGSINPIGSVVVNSGASQTFDITSNPCYVVDNVVIDGVSVGAITTYTFTNVVAKHTISATFKVKQYTISAIAGNGGSVQPGGDVLVNCGNSITFKYIPNSGYRINQETVDGIEVIRPAVIPRPDTYTFNNVSANHVISVTFIEIQKQDQTITFPAIATKISGDADFNPVATASSGLAVTYSSSDSKVATIIGNMVHIVGAGTATITASQAGDANYNAASSVGHILNVNPSQIVPDVIAITPWVSGNLNNKANASNRLMVVMVMGESTSNFGANGVTYGGQQMKKQTDKMYFVGGNRTYASIFTLNEAGVNAATSGTIAVAWSATPSVGNSIYSVLLSNVDQTTPVSIAVNNALSSTSIATTTVLGAAKGDMVIMCGATENNVIQTFNNGFIKQFETNSTWGDGVGGYKFGIGVNETPKFTQSTSGRMALCAMAVKKVSSFISPSRTSKNIQTSNAEVNGIRIYPNPVSDILYIDFAGVEASREIKVFDMEGLLQHSLKTSNSSVQIDVKSLKLKGVILIQVIEGGTISNHKVIVN